MHALLIVLQSLVAQTGNLCKYRKQSGKHFVSLGNVAFNQIAALHNAIGKVRLQLWYATRLCVVVLPQYVNHLGNTTAKYLLLLNPYVLQQYQHGFALGKVWAANGPTLGFVTVIGGLTVANLAKYVAQYIKWYTAGCPLTVKG